MNRAITCFMPFNPESRAAYITDSQKRAAPAGAAMPFEAELLLGSVWTSILRSHKGLAQVATGELASCNTLANSQAS